MNFRYRLMQFMSGRYGSDETFFVLMGIACALAIVNSFLRNIFVQLIVYLIVALAIFRVFSRKFEARRRENRKVREIIAKLRKTAETRRQRKLDFTHIYKKCPKCKAVLRLPRRKGKHSTVCPRCNHSFSVRVFRD